MARLNLLRGSTLIEAVVASIIFLIVFAASLDIITRATANESDDRYTVIEADYCIDVAFDKYSNGDYGVGTYSDTFPWGNIITEIEHYGEYKSILQITIRARVANSRKQMVYRHLIELSDRR